MSESYSQMYARLKKAPRSLENEIASAISINRDDVLRDMLTQAQTYMTWAFMGCLAERDLTNAKFYLEEELGPMLRTDARRVLESQKEEGSGRITNIQVEDAVKKDKAYLNAAKEVRHAEALKAVFRKVEEAFKQRVQMLQSLNSRQKAELFAMPEHDEDFPYDEGARPRYALPKNNDNDDEFTLAMLKENYFQKRKERS